MTYRPYFKYGIEQIQALVASSRSDLTALKVIQYELGFRDRPKAKALKVEVDELVCRLSAGAAVPPSRPVSPSPKFAVPEALAVQPPPTAPDRVAVACGNCKSPNFVSTIEGMVQHLSCSACKSPYEAQFKYGVMRTTFQAKPSNESSGLSMKWILIGLVVLVVIALITK
jgi:hypothetical protein